MSILSLLKIAFYSRPLSFHAVAFGPDAASLQEMIDIANEVEGRAPIDRHNIHLPSALHQAVDPNLPSTFHHALNDVCDFLFGGDRTRLENADTTRQYFLAYRGVS